MTPAVRPSTGQSGASRPRVAIVVPSLRGGGLERLARDHALAVRELGYEPAVFCMNGLGVHAVTLREAGVEVHDCREGRLRLRGMPVRLIRALARFKPAIIHAHSGTWLPASVARLLLRSPRLVFTDHGRYPPEPRLRARIERWCYARTDRFVAVSSPLAEYVRTYLDLPDMPTVVPNGVELAEYGGAASEARTRLRKEWGIGDHEVLALAIGRLTPVKNYAGLLEACSLAGAEAPSLRLAVLGTGPLEDALRSRARALGSRAIFLGYRADVADCLRASDLFVNSSLTEGLPVALLEAMASGVAIIASEVGGIPEGLGMPPAGLLVPPGANAELGRALARVAADPELRRELGARARARARHYSLSRMSESYCALYDGLMAGSAA